MQQRDDGRRAAHWTISPIPTARYRSRQCYRVDVIGGEGVGAVSTALFVRVWGWSWGQWGCDDTTMFASSTHNNSNKKYGTHMMIIWYQTNLGALNTMVTSELTGEVSMGVLLVFLVFWKWGRYIVPTSLTPL